MEPETLADRPALLASCALQWKATLTQQLVYLADALADVEKAHKEAQKAYDDCKSELAKLTHWLEKGQDIPF